MIGTGESLHLDPQVGGKEKNWKWLESFETLNPTPSVTHPNPPQIIPPTGHCVLTYVSLWESFSLQPPQTDT